MKSPVFSIFILLCVSFAYAQSGNTRFIDSPSWVLAKEKTASPVTVQGKQEKNDPGKTEPGAGGGPQVNPKKTQDPPPEETGGTCRFEVSKVGSVFNTETGRLPAYRNLCNAGH